ncbi:MAG: hypothetical protein SCARUB_04224 [Candidatus Scalindua rubra]|uniref:Uncharacterized protein n=1 Tax=Candidatus Scalindua rubra TaxID=1872076 RepID=A0A1E3X6P0_9BACT|nr:MAG: hypothetical protein SCARUB_04224 [Candidatus Scalindua rubra]
MEINSDKNNDNAKETEIRKFYDVHCHAFNWSHLNVFSFSKTFQD